MHGLYFGVGFNMMGIYGTDSGAVSGAVISGIMRRACEQYLDELIDCVTDPGVQFVARVVSYF